MTISQRVSASVGILLVMAFAASCSPQAQTEGIEVTRAVTTEPISGRAALYLTIKNHGPFPDVLDSVSTSAAGRAETHRTVLEGGRSQMQRIGGIPLPVDSTVRLAPGGLHVMLLDVLPSVGRGDTLDVTLFFRRYDSLPVLAPVVRHADVEAILREDTISD